MFDLNIDMHIDSDADFQLLRQQFIHWRKQFPMFAHDVGRIEKTVEEHVRAHSKILVLYRQTKNKNYLEQAQKEIDTINGILSTVEKIELMSLLTRG